eukprot:COSAG01_NODE_47402_length_390_cov_2.134021_1_plen_55_part_01
MGRPAGWKASGLGALINYCASHGGRRSAARDTWLGTDSCGAPSPGGSFSPWTLLS